MINSSNVLPNANGVYLSVGQEAEEYITCLLHFLYGIRFPGLHRGVPALVQGLVLCTFCGTDACCVCFYLSR